MPVRIMSDAEVTKFEILRDVDHERMPVRAAAQVLGLTERQVWRQPALHQEDEGMCIFAQRTTIGLSLRL